jgi:predicted dehydrogenase
MDNKWELGGGCFSTAKDANEVTIETWAEGGDLYYDVGEILYEDMDSDAIVILTPTPLHHEQVIACLDAGYPVICEKALCTSSKQAKEIVDKGGDLVVTYNYTGYPMIRELRAAINAGFLGHIQQVQIEMPQQGYSSDTCKKPQEWRMTDGDIPTLHLDLCDHMIHMYYYLTGQHPVKVVSDQDSLGQYEVIDNVGFMARDKDNRMLQGWFSKAALGYSNGLRVRVFGDNGAAEWLQSSPEYLTIHQPNGHTQVMERGPTCLEASLPRYNRFKPGHPSGFIEAMANLYWDFSETLTQPLYSAAVAYQGLQVMEAMVKSNESGKWEPVTETAKDKVKQLLLDKYPKDSMGLITFVAEAEKYLEVEFTEDEIHSEDFLTVDGLTKIVEAK